MCWRFSIVQHMAIPPPPPPHPTSSSPQALSTCKSPHIYIWFYGSCFVWFSFIEKQKKIWTGIKLCNNAVKTKRRGGKNRKNIYHSHFIHHILNKHLSQQQWSELTHEKGWWKDALKDTFLHPPPPPFFFLEVFKLVSCFFHFFSAVWLLTLLITALWAWLLHGYWIVYKSTINIIIAPPPPHPPTPNQRFQQVNRVNKNQWVNKWADFFKSQILSFSFFLGGGGKK